jgi:hypothetical protein
VVKISDAYTAAIVKIGEGKSVEGSIGAELVVEMDIGVSWGDFFKKQVCLFAAR